MRSLLLTLLSLSPAVAAVSWIPGVSNRTVAGVPFATGLNITNRDSGTATLQLSFLPAGDPSSAPAPLTRMLNSGETLSAQDALAELFSLSETSGAIRVSVDQAVLIGASRHTVSPAPVLFGTDVPVIPDDELLETGAIGDALWVSESADPSSGFSTRFQVYLADAGVTGELRLYDADGKLLVTDPLTGGPRLVEVTAASLLSAPLELGRAELRVSNGRAFGWVEMQWRAAGMRNCPAVALHDRTDHLRQCSRAAGPTPPGRHSPRSPIALHREPRRQQTGPKAPWRMASLRPKG